MSQSLSPLALPLLFLLMETTVKALTLSSSLCLRTLLATVLDPVGPTEWRRTPLHLHKVVRGWRNEKKKCIEEKANTDSFHFLSTYSLLC